MGSEILTPRELRRYNRQIILSDIGVSGQQNLKNSKVLVIGAGGLGSPVLQYLAAAGIGKIGIIEFDTVDESNLQRQVLYGTGDVGKLKSIIAKNRLEHLNSSVQFEIKNLRLDSSNALNNFSGYDIIVDATDNFDARYVINDACVILNKPMVHGSIYKYEAIVSVFNYKEGATYRCFNPDGKVKSSLNPSPSLTGLLGVLPGITGTFMANEVIKIITGYGEILSGKILVINIFNNTFRTFNVNNVPENHNINTISLK